MKLFHIKSIVALALVLAIAFSFCACASVPLLKGSDFSPAYKHFIKKMQKQLPVSVAFEQYLKPNGFEEEKLITDTDQGRIRELVEALAAVTITQQVETASNFAVRYYAFTDENGDVFTFEFYGEYLKAENKFYKTENSNAVIAVRLQEKKSGEMIAALDEAYDGKGEYLGKQYIACRELEESKDTFKVKSIADYELSPEAVITAPTDHAHLDAVSRVSADEFFLNFETVKGQENENYIFHMEVEKGVIVALEYDAALSKQFAESMASDVDTIAPDN